MLESPKFIENDCYDGSRIFTWLADMVGLSVDLVSKIPHGILISSKCSTATLDIILIVKSTQDCLTFYTNNLCVCTYWH